ncbi:MAG: methyl-accepting chemotaxis protein [Butyribacter sp.]|nr:methyl-accepting chemotaxis protein [bacterium]MDY3855012.1 methyl-accepting chemotaxis protein [Butyribacter sp.]
MKRKEEKSMMQEKTIITKEKGKKFRFGLTAKIVAMALIPAVAIGLCLGFVGAEGIYSGIQEEMISTLQAVTQSMDAFGNVLDEGDWSVDGDGNLLKGGYNLTENTEVIDKIVEDSDTQITFFYDKVRRATTLKDKETGERIIGTEASEEVYQAVVKGGEDFTSYDVTINGEPYYAYYAPMKNNDGEVVGMFFAGAPTSDVNAFVLSKVFTLIGAAVFVIVLAMIIILLVAIRLSKGILQTGKVVSTLADGELTVKVSEKSLKRKDELGDIARLVERLRDELFAVMTKVKESADVLLKAGKDLSTMASQTSSTADEIGHAVEDISKGAVSQAEDIETASARIEEMGNVIGNIVNGVAVLDNTSDTMKNAGDQSVSIINELSHSNDKTMEAIQRIGEQVNATNDSANKISEAIQLITSIAEETNLLSLNASIEAARAGEQGRGFAVVANQIQKLAEQSNESAQRIAEIITELLNDSEKTVEVMSEVQQIVNEQQEKLELTKSQFDNVSDGIEASRNETTGIKTQTEVCDDARTKVVDVITNLSAISEENAASTEETTASMQELNATINLLAESASSLITLSETLEKEIDFFKI